MQSESLFSWFARECSQAFSCSLEGSPATIIRSLMGSTAAYPWLDQLTDSTYPMKELDGQKFPNLETRTRHSKRSSGQYFTPEPFVTHLLDVSGIILSSGSSSEALILDPACGDGAFLLPVARRVASEEGGNFLGKICGGDTDAEALLITLGRLICTFPNAGWPRLEKKDFLTDQWRGTFRLILGNPPYKVNLPLDERTRLQKMFETAEGEKDVYTFFLEAGMKLLAPKGELLMLTSHTYLVNHHCKKIRAFLFNKFKLKNLFLLPTRFFPMAPGIQAVVVHLQNAQPKGKDSTLRSQFSQIENAWHFVKCVDQQKFLAPTGIRKSLVPDDLAEIFECMEAKSVLLGDIARVGVGIQESTKRSKQISRFVCNDKADNNHFPVLRGREIQPFRIAWEGKYIHYGPHLTYAGNSAIFREEKILYQNLRHESLPTRLVATLDRAGYYPKNSLSTISHVAPPFSLTFLTGLLNSRLLNAWFCGNYFSFHITVTQVRQIPIPQIDPKQQRRVESIVEKMLVVPTEKDLPLDLQIQLETAVVNCYFPEKKGQMAMEHVEKYLAKDKRLW